MNKEEYQAKCDAVEDTAYAQKGNPQAFGNELLLQNIDAFGVAISELHHKVRALERAVQDLEHKVTSIDANLNQVYDKVIEE
jgi:hypothetical protein|tara:strand:- start:691 stop:936 length:246 start_codon:yes stop_codon:yes gene_type:complete